MPQPSQNYVTININIEVKFIPAGIDGLFFPARGASALHDERKKDKNYLFDYVLVIKWIVSIENTKKNSMFILC